MLDTKNTKLKAKEHEEDKTMNWSLVFFVTFVSLRALRVKSLVLEVGVQAKMPAIPQRKLSTS
jgi:hypothetical protein